MWRRILDSKTTNMEWESVCRTGDDKSKEVTKLRNYGTLPVLLNSLLSDVCRTSS